MRPVGGHYSWQTPTQLQQLAGNTPDSVADDQVPARRWEELQTEGAV